MIFKRKKSDPSSIAIDGLTNAKICSKAESLYVGVMCFAAACLSFMTLEVGARSPLGQSVTKSATFNAIFRRSYNMKIKIMITDVMMGLVTTIMLAVGDIYGIPYLYVPWLVNTMRGMIFCEGSALIGLSYVWLPDAGIPAGVFIFITLLLFVEELCLWFDVLASFINCWKEYNEKKSREAAIKITGLPTDDNENIFLKFGEQQTVQHSGAKSKLWNDNKGSIVKTAEIILKVKSSNTNVKLRYTKSSNDSKPRGGQ